MAMPIFYLDKSSMLVVSKSIWIYVAIATSLTAVTFLYWRLSLRRKRHRRKKELEEF
jgi:hypothetical protein